MTGSIENICILYGLFGGLIGSLCLGWLCFPTSSQQSNLAVVDLSILVSVQEDRIDTIKIPSQKRRAQSMLAQETWDLLREKLEAFATENSLVLLTKGVVVGKGLPDKTAAFLTWLDTHPSGGQL